jgi:single-stranded DNA-specific DHH superfamily exonuclease
MGLPADRIQVHHLSKGTNVHSPEEASRIEAYDTDKIVVLDQGSRPGEPIAKARDEASRVLIIDHHQSAEVSSFLRYIADRVVA